MKIIASPLMPGVLQELQIGDAVLLDGVIYTGRDAVLPKIVADLKRGTYEGPDLEGAVIFHTAVSDAGVGPTSSNKLEIESSIPMLSKAGVKIHLGKGALKSETITALAEYGSVYAITPPLTALFEKNIIARKVIYHPELGIEAMNELVVKEFPLIIAAAKGASIYD